MGFKNFQSMMVKFSSEYLEPMVEANRAGEKLERPTDKAFSEIFSGYTEITATAEALDLVETLLSISPPRSKRLERDQYLKFLVGSHLQEIYALEQRMSAYGAKISRMYKRPKLPSLVKTVVYEPMEAIIRTRGTHVHTRRYSDEDLDGVATMALFRRVGHDLGDDLEFEYKRAQWKWLKQIKTNNANIHTIIDRYFDLISAVVSTDSQIRFPHAVVDASR